MTPASLKAAEQALQRDREGRLRWIEPDLGYPGRIINIRLGPKAYHFVATPDGARLGTGEYPAPDATLLLPGTGVWEHLMDRSLSVSEAIRAGKVRVWGNLNDAQAFLSIVSGR